MTEDEAKTKWCPFASMGDIQYPTAGMNREINCEAGNKCMGSDCMAWRFAHADSPSTGFCALTRQP